MEPVENLSIKELITQAGVEAFNVAVLPGAAWGDISRLGANGRNLSLHRRGYELGPVI
jgi:hypothetical protein